MPPTRTFLQTRVARRIFGLFLLCAVVPAVTLAASGYWLVSNEMRAQAGLQLAQASKISGTLLLARLHVADEELAVATAAGIAGKLDWIEVGRHVARLRSLSFDSEGRPSETLWGNGPTKFPVLSKGVTRHLRAGRAAVVVHVDSTGPKVYLVREVRGRGPALTRAWGEVSPTVLWGDRESESVAPAGVELCVYGTGGSRPLYCSRGALGISTSGRRRQGQTSEILDRREEEVVTGSSSVFLGFEFSADPWTVVLEQPFVSMSAAVEFRRSVVLTLITGLALVVLASNILLRQRLDPVARLREGTRRLAAGDFSTPVQVSTGDEFEDLAISFNSMVTSLREQFELLGALQEVDREALKTHTDVGIVTAAAPRLSRLASHPGTVIVGVARRSRDVSQLSVWRTSADGSLAREDRPIPSSDLEALEDRPSWFESAPGKTRAGMLDALGVDRSSGCLVLPLLQHGVCFGAVVLTGSGPGSFACGDTERLRQLADQMALALSHCLLLERLNAMSFGTLEALARTIDAVSPWTAGHSERVTRVAMAIGRQMNLGEEEIDRLRRGGLLHDVGKIGIPAAVLDKPAALDPDEMAIVRAHPEVGARILQPIHAYEDVLDIVRSHHERYDGGGYPDRLVGLHIPFLARVLAVADVYDALVSDRPYRRGWTSEAAVGHIRERAGSHFDPLVAKAFLDLVDGELWAGVMCADTPRGRRTPAEVST